MRRSTRTFCTGMLAGALALPALALAALTIHAGLEIYDARKRDTRPEKRVDGLVVNHDNKHRTRATLDEIVAIERMREFCVQHDKEESWAYVPATNEWIETGSDEHFEPGMSSVTQDSKYIESLFGAHDSLTMYHYHPSGDFLHKHIFNTYAELGLQVSDAHKHRIDEQYRVIRALPSTNDMAVMALQSLQFYDKQPSGRIAFRICSHYGVTEYALTSEGVAHYGARFEQMEWLRQPQLARALASDVDYLNEETDPIRRIRAYCEMMSTSRFTVTFTPYEELLPVKD